MPRACVVCEHLSITAVTCIADRLLFIVTHRRMFIDETRSIPCIRLQAAETGVIENCPQKIEQIF